MNSFGLSENSWMLLSKIALKPLSEHGSKIWVFGSRATGKHREFSDIDILIDPPQGLPRFLLSNIRTELEESNLPIKVDLVLESDLPDSYRENIENQKVRVHI